MKPIRLFQHLSLMALCAATALPVMAQAPPTVALPATTPPREVAPSFSCEVPASQLEKAVAIVAKAAEAKGIEMPNTLFAPDSAELKVPQLKLRSVTPSGALSLLAAAAGCDVEQVVTPDTGEVSGWMFKARDGSRWEKRAQQSYGLHLSNDDAIGSIKIENPRPGVSGFVPGPQVASEPVPKPSLNVFGQGFDRSKDQRKGEIVIGMGGGARGMMNGAPSQAPVTKVYAVGLLLDEAKPDSGKLLEITLREVLEVAAGDEKPRTEPTLLFHGGTKLLVAKATPEAQALIEQTLQAMTQNANDLKTGRRITLRQRVDEGVGSAGPGPKEEEKILTLPGLPPSPQPAIRK